MTSHEFLNLSNEQKLFVIAMAETNSPFLRELYRFFNNEYTSKMEEFKEKLRKAIEA